MEKLFSSFVLFIITLSSIKAIEDDYINFGSIKCTTTGEICPINVTCEFTCKFSCLNFYNKPDVFGTFTYSSESSICKSALHDLRISTWDPSARSVTVKTYEKDECFLESSVRFGFSSHPVEQNESCSVFEFVSPRISENILDAVSMHSNYLFQANGTHTQYCFVASNVSNQLITFDKFSNWKKSADNVTVVTPRKKNYVQAVKVWNEATVDGYQCIPSNTTLSIITSIAFSRDSWFYPSAYTVTVNKNDNVTLTMTESYPTHLFRSTVWRKNGRLFNLVNGVQRTNLTLTNVHEGHSGIYSLGYESNELNGNKSGIVQLIVRSCPKGLYGTNCSETCPVCLNNGVCHDITGECICAPGFNGTTCESACRPGYVGKKCDIQCPAQKPFSKKDNCRSLLICLPSPYGCSCAFGFKGLFCDKDYPVLKAAPVVSDITKIAATIEFKQWTQFEDFGSGVAVAYDIVFKQSGDLYWSYAGRIFHPCPIMLCKATIENLEPAIRYEIAVLVVDENGHREETGIKTTTVRTLCTKPSSPPLYIRLHSEDLTIFIKWELPPREFWNCWKLRSLVKFKNVRYNFLNRTYTENTTLSFFSEPSVTWIIQVCLVPYTGTDEMCSDIKTITARGSEEKRKSKVQQSNSMTTISILGPWHLNPMPLVPHHHEFEVATSHSLFNFCCKKVYQPVKVDVIQQVNAISLRWLPPPDMSNKIVSYGIEYEDLQTRLAILKRFSVKEATCPKEDEKDHSCYVLDNLVANHEYAIKLTAYLRNDVRGVRFRNLIVRVPGRNYVTLIFAIFLPLAFMAVILFMVLIYMNKRRKLNNSVENDALDELDIIELESLCEELTNAIRIEDLMSYVKSSIQTNKIKKEFMIVPTGQIYPCNAAKLFENKPKNRYGNILPYDHSRVVLNNVKGDPSSNYIHANYIPGYEKSKKYIATQGPLLCTVNDFWRMVWNEGSCKILMITKFSENGRPKCEKYWTETTCQYGEIIVTFQNSVSYAEFTIRTFAVSKVQGKITREVKQFHFTTWPDHSVPPNSSPFLNFLHKARSYKPDSDNPIVIHCSAGIGRTGTAILLDSMIDMGLREKKVDVVNHLCSMRKQRMNIVENLEQYTFVYNALVDRFCIKDTRIKCSDFKKKFEKLQNIDATGMTFIEKQFKILNQTPDSFKKDIVSAYQADNQWKNRSMRILPPDQARPRLSSVYSSFYINAIYVDSYTKKNAFIATQYPLPDTLKEFWNMIYELNSETVVILQDLDISDEDIPMLWVPDDVLVLDRIQVAYESTVEEDILNVVKICITSNDSQDTKPPLSVNVLFFPNWRAGSKLPSEISSFLSLISRVQSLQESKSHIITAVCFDGALASGVFCAVLYICDQIKTERTVDIFRASKCIRSNRKEFILDADQYKFLYDFVLTYLNS